LRIVDARVWFYYREHTNLVRDILSAVDKALGLGVVPRKVECVSCKCVAKEKQEQQQYRFNPGRRPDPVGEPKTKWVTVGQKVVWKKRSPKLYKRADCRRSCRQWYDSISRKRSLFLMFPGEPKMIDGRREYEY